MKNLTTEDITMLIYYWDKSEDITRYAGYDDIKPILEQKHPEVSKAFKDFETARKNVKAVLTNLYSDDER